jgi:hypothetical protein
MAKIVAVTSCPTGIAHTIMAAEGLEQAAKQLGHDIQVETQGSVGTRNTLTDERYRRRRRGDHRRRHPSGHRPLHRQTAVRNQHRTGHPRRRRRDRSGARQRTGRLPRQRPLPPPR